MEGHPNVLKSWAGSFGCAHSGESSQFVNLKADAVNMLVAASFCKPQDIIPEIDNTFSDPAIVFPNSACPDSFSTVTAKKP